MPSIRQPRFGSLQFVPHRRSKRPYSRIRSWATNKENKLLAFAGYKIGMAHLLYTENNKLARFFKEVVSTPVTLLECPPMTIYGVRFYEKSYTGKRAVMDVILAKPKKELHRTLCTPKKLSTSFDSIPTYDDIVLLCHTNPAKTGIGKKKPEVFEVHLGGTKEEKLSLAKKSMGKDVTIEEVFSSGDLVDAHGVTKGKGFQGPVKNSGISLRSHKAEKNRRFAVLAAEGNAKVNFTAHQSRKMGYNLRTQFNSQIMKIGNDKITPASGFARYGVVKNTYLVVKGSLQGPKKSLITLTKATRPLLKNTTPEIINLITS